MIKKALALAFIAIILVAVPVLALVPYSAPYTVTEDASNSYDMLGVVGLSNNQWMADNGFMNSSANDTRIETLGGLEKPHMVSDNRTLTAIPVPANSQTNLYYTTGNSELDSFYTITGYDGYVTASDNADIELSDNFTVELKGWVDTTADGANLTNKELAFRSFINGSGDITSSILLGWTSPDAHDDPDTEWANEAQAYNDNIGDFAEDSSIGMSSWSSYLELSLSTTWMGDKIRAYCSGTTADIDEIDIDAYYNGAWNDVYEGSFTQSAWVTYEVDSGLVHEIDKIRIRLYNSDAGEVRDAYIHDVDVINTASSVTASSVSSGEYTVRTAMEPYFPGTDYVLSFDGTNDYVNIDDAASIKDFTDCTIEVWLRTSEAVASSRKYFISKDAAGNNVGDASFYIDENAPLGRATFDDAFNGVAVSTNSSIADGEWHYLVFTLSSTEGYKLFHQGELEDSDNTTGNTIWNNATPIQIGGVLSGSEGLAFDGLIDEVRIYSRAISSSEITYNYANKETPQSQTDLEAWWHFNDMTGTNANDETANNNDGTLINGARWARGDFKIYIDGEEKDAIASMGVPDNANDWSFITGNVMPYMEYLTFTIDGTERLRYQPTSMIIGTNLPNEAVPGSYNGTIHWGDNPSGVDVSIGSMVSSGQPSIGVTGEEPASDILPPVEVSDWYVDPDVGGALLTNPMRPIVTMLSDNSTMTEIQAWRLLALALILLVAATTARAVGRHQGLTMISVGTAIGAMVAFTIFPLWTLIFAIGMFIGGLVMERSPSL